MDKISAHLLAIVPPVSYPGRIYGMYKWNDEKERWEIDEVFCKENGIKISKKK